MKKIIPYFTNIYTVVLYIGQEGKYCIAYSANNIFSKGNRKREKLEDMAKIEFEDIESANIYLATKIYPNIDNLNGTVENATLCEDKKEEEEYATTGCSGGGSGSQYYFAGAKNFRNHYFSFYMSTENYIRNKILAARKASKIR